MMKLNKKVLNSSLVVLLALGLGGCAANSATTTHKTHEATSSQVVKQSSHKKADNKSAKSASEQSVTKSSSSSVSSTAVSQASATTSTKSAKAAATASSNTKASSSSVSNANNVAVAPAKSTSQISNVKQNEQKQLGLGDVASWTDAKGVTHHVDSDGMDRYTTKGSSQVQYQDFSGSLPSDAVITHQN